MSHVSDASPSSDEGSSQPTLRLFDVTLDWDVNDRELGDYGANTWAATRKEAVRQVAEEMVDSGEIDLPKETSPDYDKARADAMAHIVAGASVYAAIDVGARLLNDIEQILAGPGDAYRNSAAFKTDYDAVRSILNKYLPA